MTNVISELRNTTGSSKLYKLRKFLASDYFCALVVLYSVAVICFNWIIPGAFLLAVIVGFVFILSDDIVSVFLPIMLIASFGIQANDSLWDYMALAPFAAFPIFAILFHHIFYRERDKSKVKRPGALLLPMILVSITNFLGGIGTGIVVVDALILIAICIVLTIVSISFVHAITARLKIEQVFKFYWTTVTGLALISLVLAWYGL